MVSNCANVAAAIEQAFNHGTRRVNWAGFYLVRPFCLPYNKNACVLRLGPFVGKPAVTIIPYSRGVCGACASSEQTQLVPDVHQFPGHIACDSVSQSEIVVPVFATNVVRGARTLVAVIDIDSPELNFFTDKDRRILELVAELIGQGCDWVNMRQLARFPLDEVPQCEFVPKKHSSDHHAKL
eukprot:c7174_g1_i1.p1 GENE.c7174_g1_i1~~c7174_g1_i1.p1  ORF type:complete len:214 (+),score=43.37 c7174_g1_i1:99-644(+)